jgi:hypothetical protein
LSEGKGLTAFLLLSDFTLKTESFIVAHDILLVRDDVKWPFRFNLDIWIASIIGLAISLHQRTLGNWTDNSLVVFEEKLSISDDFLGWFRIPFHCFELMIANVFLF